ncbi:MAG: hypothetical protein Ct9H300mP1_13790 [Planctomycetaceae bacterium]|nr:MAG: hypothetical protein Ct9H300mP1_13790 [Planctomycetaceae bacterium]
MVGKKGRLLHVRRGQQEHHELVIKLAKRAKLHYPEVTVMISTHVMSDELAAALDAGACRGIFLLRSQNIFPTGANGSEEDLSSGLT